MLVVDACREPASTARAFGGRPRSFSKFDASGLAFLQSCGSKERSWEHPEVGGVFTHFFCEGLRGAAARDNGGVTFLDACGYASRETQRFVADRRAAEQTPFFTFSGVVDFWLKEPMKETTLSDSVALALKQGDSVADGLPEEYHDANQTVFNLIRGGSFMMGTCGLSPEEISEKYPGARLERLQEATRHKVTLTKPFYMARYETTVAEFKKFVDATGYVTTAEKIGLAFGLRKDGGFGAVDGANWRNPTIPQEPTHPVVCVSWDDVAAYIAWLNKNAVYSEELGRKPFYRLPTEAEWEYACRAGTQTEFFWGTNEPKDGEGYLNAADKSGAPCSKPDGSVWPFNDGYVGLAPVGSFKPNLFGLYDMAGNAMEWCSDWIAPYVALPQINPTGAPTGWHRVARGGAWNLTPVWARSNNRHGYWANNSSVDRGFRVVIDLGR